MVAHLWANKAQPCARVATGNFYFDGDTIYSYGSHFPIARHVKGKGGTSAVLFTTKGYSATTAQHKAIVASACRHLTTFHVADVRAVPREDFADYRQRFAALVGSYANARQRRPAILAEMRALTEEANGFAEFYGLKIRLSLPADLSAMVAECKRQERREKERKQREARKRQEEARKQLEAWSNGESDYLPSVFYDSPIRLRVKGDELQTSRGARVPLDHAVKAFRVIKRLKQRGESYERNGHTIHLGHFALDRVDSDGNVTAGCHHVAWDEIERVATLVGVN